MYTCRSPNPRRFKMAAMLVHAVDRTVIMACGSLSECQQMSAEMQGIERTCHLSTADFRCNSYGFLLTINPDPSESGTSFSGFLIIMCSAWKLPSIMKPRINRFWLIQTVGGFQGAIPIDAPIFVVTPVFREVDAGLCAQSTEYRHRTRFRIFIFTIPKTKPLSGNQSSPKSADS